MPQIDVNQRYALYYPEKRPFFLEGRTTSTRPSSCLYANDRRPSMGGQAHRQEQGNDPRFLSSMDMNSPEISLSRRPKRRSRKGPLYRSLVSIFRLKKDLLSESMSGSSPPTKRPAWRGIP